MMIYIWWWLSLVCTSSFDDAGSCLLQNRIVYDHLMHRHSVIWCVNISLLSNSFLDNKTSSLLLQNRIEEWIKEWRLSPADSRDLYLDTADLLRTNKVSSHTLSSNPIPCLQILPHWLVKCLQSLHTSIPFLCCCGCYLYVLLLCVVYMTPREDHRAMWALRVCLYAQHCCFWGSSTMVCLFMCHAVLCTMPTCICERKEVQSLAQLPVATTLILPTGELCFEPVVFNRRQHQHQDLMGGLLPLSALSAYRDPHIP